MRRITTCIGALLLGVCTAHPVWAQSEELSATGTAAEIVGAFLEIGRLLRPANDNSAGDNNLYFGYAQAATGRDVPGGFGICVPTNHASISACLQELSGLSANDCALRMAVASGAIQNTKVVTQQTINPVSGTAFPTVYGALGGLCYQPDMSGNAYFAGWLQGRFFIHLGNNLPNYVCQWLINQSQSPASCGLIGH